MSLLLSALVPNINPLSREISAKIVYYGPGLSGKTTSLQYLHSAVRPERRGDLVSLATETDRTIFFDFLPLHVERVRGLGVRFQLYTVPGQVFYAATRQLVLNGADGVVFVADSQPSCRDKNLESLEGLRANLEQLDIDFEDFPIVFQYNKRDLPDALPLEELSSMLNFVGAPELGSSATSGEGVLAAFKSISRLVIRSLTEQQPALKRKLVDEDAGDDASIAGSVRSAILHARDTVLRPDEPASQHPPAAPPGISVTERVEPASELRELGDAHAGSSAVRGLSFAAFWSGAGAAQIVELERCIARGEHAAAVLRSSALLAELLDALPGPDPGGDSGPKAALLGLDGHEFLRACRLATTPAEALTEQDALRCYYLLISARLKSRHL